MNMLSTIKIIGFAGLFLLSTQGITKSKQLKQTTKKQAICFCNDKDIVADALKNIKEIVEQGNDQPNIASCTYTMNGNTPILATTKLYYALNYRKKRLSKKKSFATSQNITSDSKRTIKITFNKNDKNSVQLTERGAFGKRKIEIAIPAIDQI